MCVCNIVWVHSVGNRSENSFTLLHHPTVLWPTLTDEETAMSELMRTQGSIWLPPDFGLHIHQPSSTQEQTFGLAAQARTVPGMPGMSPCLPPCGTRGGTPSFSPWRSPVWWKVQQQSVMVCLCSSCWCCSPYIDLSGSQLPAILGHSRPHLLTHIFCLRVLVVEHLSARHTTEAWMSSEQAAAFAESG